MDHIQVIIDNRIPLKLLQVNEGESVIFCKSFKEELFNSGFFSTKDKDFVHNYIVENEQKYIVTDVTTPDDKVYKNVKFRVVVNENADVPYSTFNPQNIISEKSEYKLPAPIKVETNKTTTESKKQTKINLNEKLEKQKQEQEYFEKAIQLQNSLLQEKTDLEIQRKKLEKTRQNVETEKLANEKLAIYKQELISEFFNVSEKQENIIKEKLFESHTYLENKIQEQNKENSEKAKIVLEKLNEKNLNYLKTAIDEKIKEKRQEIEKIIDSKTEYSARLLVEKADELKKLFDEKFVLDLQNCKETLYLELVKVSDENAGKFLEKNKVFFNNEIREFFKTEKQKAEKNFSDGIESVKQILEKTSEDLKSKNPELDEKIKIINEKIQELTEQKKTNQVLIGEAKTYTDKEIKKALEESRNYAKRILDLGGGGGSVAVQYLYLQE